jgi:hypothetical protein
VLPLEHMFLRKCYVHIFFLQDKTSVQPFFSYATYLHFR